MVDTGFSSFSTTVDKTNAILHEIELVHGWPKHRRMQSYAALRAVLHALRDRLTVAEASQLAAQLPILVRGIFYDGWEPARMPHKMNADQFLTRVRREFPYEVAGGLEGVVRSVALAVRRYVDEGEWGHAMAALPADVRKVLTVPAPA